MNCITENKKDNYGKNIFRFSGWLHFLSNSHTTNPHNTRTRKKPHDKSTQQPHTEEENSHTTNSHNTHTRKKKMGPKTLKPPSKKRKEPPTRRNPTSISTGSSGQQIAARKLLKLFLEESNITWEDVEAMSIAMKKAEREGSTMPRYCLYSLLHSFGKFLYNHESVRSKNAENVLSEGTADNYLSQVKQILCDSFGGLDEKKCAKVRSDMRKLFIERATRLQITQQQAPGATVNDMQILLDLLYQKGDCDSLHFGSMLVLQWHMLGRSIDSCWLSKRQLSVMTDGDLFINFTRLKTSSLQGI